jgi:hypothetical protein
VGQLGLLMGAQPAVEMAMGGHGNPQQDRADAARHVGMSVAQAASLGDDQGFQKVLSSPGMHPAVGDAHNRMWNSRSRPVLANQDAAANAVYQMHQHLRLNPNLTGAQLTQIMGQQKLAAAGDDREGGSRRRPSTPA